jgi:hypothetical protein
VKRGGPSHPKTLHFAALVHLVRYEAVGVLECLFHWAGLYARRGDIGKFPDAAIAEGVGWEGDPVQLVSALVESGWLDRCECHRLRVHDWAEHADAGVRQSAQVKDQGFLECYTAQRLSPGYPKAEGGTCDSSAVNGNGTGKGNGTGQTVTEERVKVVDAAGNPAKPDPVLAAVRQECQDALDAFATATGRNKDQLLAYYSRPKTGTATIVNIWACHSVDWLRKTAERLRGARLAEEGERVEQRAAKARASPDKPATLSERNADSRRAFLEGVKRGRPDSGGGLVLGGPSGDRGAAPEAGEHSNSDGVLLGPGGGDERG